MVRHWRLLLLLENIVHSIGGGVLGGGKVRFATRQGRRAAVGAGATAATRTALLGTESPRTRTTAIRLFFAIRMVIIDGRQHLVRGLVQYKF